jgi:hypothetical protein
MAELVYVLCTATSFFCMVLLYRGYRRTKNLLLFWSAVCFLGFALNNFMVILDLVILGPEQDLAVARIVPALLGVMAMIYGLVRDVD